MLGTASSPLEIECFDGIGKNYGEKYHEAEKYSRYWSKHAVFEPEVTVQELFYRFICAFDCILNLSKLRHYETIQGVGHGCCPVVPSPPYRYSLSQEIIHSVVSVLCVWTPEQWMVVGELTGRGTINPEKRFQSP